MFKSTATSMIVVGVLTCGVTQIAAGSQLRSVGQDVGTVLRRAA
jgi:hypothetical protein